MNNHIVLHADSNESNIFIFRRVIVRRQDLISVGAVLAPWRGGGCSCSAAMLVSLLTPDRQTAAHAATQPTYQPATTSPTNLPVKRGEAFKLDRIRISRFLILQIR